MWKGKGRKRGRFMNQVEVRFTADKAVVGEW